MDRVSFHLQATTSGIILFMPSGQMSWNHRRYSGLFLAPKSEATNEATGPSTPTHRKKIRCS
eukprot:scaffold103499_cov28-Prasinocladus_malaysianus.AAC.3